ncbi:HlyD family secretion protein [Paracraurococcus ruber]|uniref:HlyD family secretion protein n=1 Tax=Paracraurococcus ruber TaxID=77675 RepID=UPI0013052BCF|nr:biotin/lipoyl-binding protein [Paracraurococcus ruber]
MTRIDQLRAEQRRSPVQWAKGVYLLLLLGLSLAGLNWAMGDAVMLQADGLVVTDRSVAAATYPARVARVLVREGQRVQAGEVVAEVESAEMLRDIAQVSAQNAELTTKELQLRIRAAGLQSLLPMADRHARQSVEAVAKLDGMSSEGWVSLQRKGEALGSQYEAAARLAGLRSEATVLTTELPMVIRTREKAAESLAQLQAFYDNGRVRAGRAGVVGARVPLPGQVVRLGEELLQIHADTPAILAYLPDIYLFGLEPGERVVITGGTQAAEGVVEALLPVSDALPQEFQSMFRPRDRSRLVRVRMTEGSPFALSQKVQVRGCAFGWCWKSEPFEAMVADRWDRALTRIRAAIGVRLPSAVAEAHPPVL